MMKPGYYRSEAAACAAAERICSVYGEGTASASRDVNRNHRVAIRGAAFNVYDADRTAFNAAVKKGARV